MSARFVSDRLCLSTGSSTGATNVRYGGDLLPGVATEAATVSRPSVEAPLELAPFDELYVPDHYEAAYAYPLIVWLKGESAPRESLCAMMRRISDRNCFGFSVRAAAGSPIDVRIHAAVTYLRQRYHVHSERIYLGGQAEMAASAIEIGLDLPEWFAGLVALSPIASRKRRLLARFDAIRGIRVFLACGDDAAIARNVRRTQRLLWGAGLSVHAVSSRSSDELDSGVLREIDRWLIQAIEEVEAAV